MNLLLALAIGTVIGVGIYLTLSRDLLRCVIGLSIIGSGANLTMLASGGFAFLAPPIIPAGAEVLTAAANPLPQALVLTAIVIGFALVCLSLTLLIALKHWTGATDTEQLRYAEPGGDADGKPLPLPEHER